MRPGVLLREAWRDVVSGAANTTLLAVALLVAVLGPAWFDFSVIASLNHKAEQFRSVMAAVQVIRAPGRIDAAACEALSLAPGVNAAAVRETTGLAAAAALAAPFKTYEATPSIAALLRVTPPVGGAYLVASAAEALGVEDGDALPLADGTTVMVQDAFQWSETDSRRSGFGHSLFLPVAATGAFDECWVETWPHRDDAAQLAMLALIPGGDGQRPELIQFNSSLGASFDGPAEFAGRASRFAVAAVAVGCLIAAFAATWRRRLELASDLHAGVRRVDLAWKLMLESLSAVSPALVSLTALGIWYQAAALPSDRQAFVELAWCVAAVGLGATLCGTLIGVFAARESQLNRYFKTR